MKRLEERWNMIKIHSQQKCTKIVRKPNIPTMQLFIGISGKHSVKVLYVSVSGTSIMMHCEILVNMPYACV